MNDILIVSGSRADLAYLIPIAEAFSGRASARIESLADALKGADTAQAIAERAGAILSAGGRTLADERPDLMLVLGDRWEILAACQAAVLAGIPIAHVAAGEVTLGSYDNRFRQAIEALASVHFALTQRGYANLQGRGFLAGCTSVRPPETIPEGDGHAIMVLHPETAGEGLDPTIGKTTFDLLLARGLKPIHIGANVDVGAAAFGGAGSVPFEDFHRLLAQASLIIGNSSAGIIEAPILGTPTVNIGVRQLGRPCAESVFHAAPTMESIAGAIDRALAFGKQRVASPYWHDHALATITEECLAYLGRSQK